MENYSLSDLAAVVTNKSDCNGGFGGNSMFLMLILFLLISIGGGGLGWGNNGACGAQTNAEIQRGFDNSAVVNKLDRISEGMCNSTYTIGNAVNQGFNNTNMNMVQGLNNVGNMVNDVRYSVQNCCCETNRNIDAVRYENAKNTCDIINAGNANTQRIIDTITGNTIQELRDQLQAAQLQLGTLSQTNTLINTIRPFPEPAYITCSPYQAVNLNTYGNGYGNRCMGSCGYNI